MKKYFLAIIFLALIVFAGVWAFNRWIWKPSKEMVSTAGQSLASGINKAFNLTPSVSIDNTVVVEEYVPILEIAVLSQNIFHDYIYTQTQLWSTKELHLKGSYIAKAGFDMKDQNFSVRIDSDQAGAGKSYKLAFMLPSPRILSFETERYEVIKDEDGWWNEITKEEHENAVNTMKAEAKEKALQQGILQKAKQSAQKQLWDIVKTSDFGGIQIAEIKFFWIDEISSFDPGTTSNE
jgi:hypothetical protein